MANNHTQKALVPLISISEALELLDKHIPLPQVETVDLLEAMGRIVAEPIEATVDSPPYSNSAMDGFAVRWSELETLSGDHPVTLRIRGESQAGDPFHGELTSGEAIRISTGAIMPDALDTVIPIEVCEVTDDTVTITAVKQQFQHVRYQGEEFQRGGHLLDPGVKLDVAQLALLASQGVHKLPVYAQPRVAILVTGQELVPFDASAEPHQLRDSNRPMLKAAVEATGGVVSLMTHVEDDLQATIQAIQDAEAAADIILLSGGVSMGAHDHVRPASQACGFEQVFWRINQKPGKPLFLAEKPDHVLLGLPGNPVSAFMCFQHYGSRLIKRAGGDPTQPEVTPAAITHPLRNHGARTTMVRVQLTQGEDLTWRAQALKQQGSHMLTSISQADGYFILEGRQELNQGTSIDVIRF